MPIDLKPEITATYRYILCIVVVRTRTHNPLVVGSSPTGPTKFKPLQALACKGFLLSKIYVTAWM